MPSQSGIIIALLGPKHRLDTLELVGNESHDDGLHIGSYMPRSLADSHDHNNGFVDPLTWA